MANPNRDDTNAGPPLGRNEAQNYATQLAEITQFITEQYVREVSRADLSLAALKGLHEAANVSVPGGLEAEIQRAAGSEYELRKLFARVRLGLRNPPSLRGHGAIFVSLQAMMASLDPYSTVSTATDAQVLNPRDPIQGFGLELVDSSGAGPLVIKSVMPGGPAQKAGLRPGDVITQVNESPANTGLAGPLAFSKLDALSLQVTRPASKNVVKVSLKSEAFYPELILGVMRKPDNSWDYFVDHEHKIAQIRVAALNPGVADELFKTLNQLHNENLRGLILDLRWCPGGYLDDSRETADLFLPRNAPNATVRYRNGRSDDRIPHARGSFLEFPMVVLVNGETTGGAELIAAVLQDDKRARIAGQRTRGKASVQRRLSMGGEIGDLTLTIPIPNTELKLTSGILARPSGKNLNRFADSKPTDDWGVQPDPELEFRVSAALGRQLQEWWLLQTLRPGRENLILPLDDPGLDPQRQASLRVLLGMLR